MTPSLSVVLGTTPLYSLSAQRLFPNRRNARLSPCLRNPGEPRLCPFFMKKNCCRLAGPARSILISLTWFFHTERNRFQHKGAAVSYVFKPCPHSYPCRLKFIISPPGKNVKPPPQNFTGPSPATSLYLPKGFAMPFTGAAGARRRPWCGKASPGRRSGQWETPRR